jgi:fermentation-respiration switch protein FrsA (DUF1100 family)
LIFGGDFLKKALKLVFISFFFIFFIGFYFTNRLMYIKKKDHKLIFDREINAGRFDPEAFEALSKQDAAILSPFGYMIKAQVIEPHQSNRYIIIAHGVTENKVNSIKYMNIFLKRGFNAVIYDHRRHGESGGKTTSYGHYEKYDLKAVVDWLEKEKGPNLLLGIHGESMGAATMLLYAGMLEDKSDFYIADCSFSNLMDQLRHQIQKELKLPPSLVLPIGNLFLRLRDKYSISDVSPISVIDQIQHPILFIHSKKDDFILPTMTEKLFAQKQGPKMLFLAENGRHAQSLNDNPDDYEKAIDEFLEKHVGLMITKD